VRERLHFHAYEIPTINRREKQKDPMSNPAPSVDPRSLEVN